jgi:hypothetical protein
VTSTPKDLTSKALERLGRHGFTNNRLDAKDIEALLAEIIGESFQAGVETGTKQKPEPRRIKRFSFDTPKLQATARAKFLKEGFTWQQVSDSCGIAVNALKQHLGEKPPVEMGLKVVVGLMVFIGDFDVLGFLIEDEEKAA